MTSGAPQDLDLFVTPTGQAPPVERPIDVTFLEDSLPTAVSTPEPIKDSAPPLDIISLSHLLSPPKYAASFLDDELAAPPQKRRGAMELVVSGDDDELDEAALVRELLEAESGALQMPPLFGDDVDKKLVLRVLNRSRILKKYLDPTTLQRQMNGVRRRVSVFAREPEVTSVVSATDGPEPGLSTPIDDDEPDAWETDEMDDLERMPPAPENKGEADDDERDPTAAASPRLRTSTAARAPVRLGGLAEAVADVMQVAPSKLAKALEAQTSPSRSPLTLPELTLRDDATVDLTPGAVASVSENIAQKQRDKYVARATTDVITQLDELDPSTPRRRPEAKKQAVPLLVGGADVLPAADATATVEEMYEAALAAERAKEWRRATLLACACINTDKEWVEAIFLRARLCRRLGLWSQALKDLTAALRLCPSNHRLHLQRSHIHTMLHDYSAAIHDLTSVLSQQPNSAEALLLRSQIYAKQNNIAFAIKDLSAILKFDPKNWRAYYERGHLRHLLMEGLARDKDVDPESQVSSPQLMSHVLDDYISALRSGCTIPDVVEAIGDVCLRLVACSCDAKPLLHTIHALAGLVAMVDETNRKAPRAQDRARLKEGSVTLLSCLLTQRGRLQILIGEHAKASVDLDRAVVLDYHYAPAHFYRGALASLYAHDEGARKTVEQHLTRSLTLDPTITGAYVARGGVYAADLRYNSALQDFKAAVTVDPTLDAIWLEIGIIFLAHYHDCAACVTVCTTALANDRSLARALYLRGESFARLGNLPAAIRDYVRLGIMDPTDRFAHLLQGRQLLQMGHARPALYCYMAFMELAGVDVDRISRGIAYRVLSQHAKAVHEFKLAVEVDPSSANLYLLSEALHSMGDTEASLETIERAILADPFCAKNYLRRAQCLLGRGALKSAILEYDRALTLAEKAELPRMLYERALCRMQLLLRCWQQVRQLQAKTPVECRFEGAFRPGSPLPETLPEAELSVPALLAYIKTVYHDALSDFARCLKLSSAAPFVDAYIDRAELFALGGDYRHALADLAAALAVEPGNVRAFIHRGLLDCRFARHAASIVHFDLALQHHPTNALAHYNRGVAYHHLGVHAQAEADYSRALALDETNLDALRNRGIVRCHLTDFAGALGDFEQVHRNAPDDLELYLGLGYVYLKLGRFTEAIALFRASASVNPRSVDAFQDAGNTFLTMALYLSQSANPLNALHSSGAKTDSFRSLLAQALHCYQRALRLDPTSVECRLNLGALFCAQRDMTNALRQYGAVQALDPANHIFHEESALMRAEAGDDTAALAHWSAAIALTVATNNIIEMEFTILVNTPYDARRSPADGNMRKVVSWARPDVLDRLLAQKALAVQERLATRWRRVESPAAAKSIAGLKKKLAVLLTERGKVYERLHELEKAHLEYLYASYFDPLAAAVYFQLGTLALRQRRLEAAATNLHRAIALNPKLGLAQLNLAVVFVQQQLYPEALEALDVAGNLMPECGFVWSNRACVLLKAGGDRKAAVASLTQAMRCMPTYAPFYVFRGRVLTKQKHLHDAMVDFAAALQMGYSAKL
ncbi:hypothetical protein ACHHYP_10047 [Achlya hypogyna]|uniref:Uncharacterized protein n=1 Tax=Achlya hypogyna TaxID=1202772 RepID=A0A1V9ZIG9_ACHHY|nr:hypothetical protein ACHHYP_10047 [Achlya hypogyna]